MLAAAKTRANKKKLPFSITKTDILKLWEDQNHRCFYTNEIMTHIGETPNMLSIDRLNSDLGYTLDNICLASWEINRIKSNIG